MMVDTISPDIRSIRLSMNEFMDWGHILITIIRTDKFVAYGYDLMVFIDPTNKFVGYQVTIAVRNHTNEFGPYLIRHQNTRPPNGTHDFNHGNYNAIRHHPATHDFSRGTINPNRKSPSTHEFMRGKKEVTC